MANALYVLALTASLAVLADAAAGPNPYCQLKSCQGQIHTICKFPYLQPSKSCGVVKSSTLTENEIQELVDVHNKYRELVASGQEKRGSPGPQPAAVSIPPLKWDKELASIAQAWANQCSFGHDKCRDVERFQVGQNAGYKASTDLVDFKLSTLVTSWYDEVALFNRDLVKSVTKFDGVGHYTQMVWATTTLVGCGVVRYNPDHYWNYVYLVCNYGPTGNWHGKELYKTR